MTQTLLIVATGQTDVQLAVESERGRARREFTKEACGAMHSKLEERLHEWTFCDAKGRPKIEPAAAVLPSEGTFELCTPKLDAILTYLDNEGLTLTHCLLLETRRPDKGDPAYAGRVLGRRIHERISAHVDVQYGTYVWQANERIEGPRDPRDAIVRREVVARIERSVIESIRSAEPEHVVLALTGGMPMLDLVIEECVRLQAITSGRIEQKRATIPVTLVKVPETDHARGISDDVAVPETAVRPHLPAAVRRRALELLAEGHALGAWGAAKAFDGNADEQWWVDVFRSIYRWTARLPPDRTPGGIPLLANPLRAVWAAVQVEMALRAANVPAATHGTVAFLESALWDHLDGVWLERVGVSGNEYRLLRPLPPDLDLVRTGTTEDAEEDWNRPFAPVASDSFSRAVGDRVRVYDRGDLARLVEMVQGKTSPLERLRAAIDPMRRLRNDVAHNVPTPTLVAEAQQTAQQQKLWSGEQPPTFLSQPLVQSVLEALGVVRPDALFEDFLRDVTRIVTTPRTAVADA